MYQVNRAAFRAFVWYFPCGHYPLLAFLALEGRDPNSPDNLPGDIPVFNVFHPMVVIFLKAFGVDFYFAGLDCLNSRLGKLGGLNKPLFQRKRLNSSAAFITSTHPVAVIFVDLFDQPLLLHLFYNGCPGFHDFHPGKPACFFIKPAVKANDLADFQVMPFPHFKIGRVMGRGNFDDPGAKFRVNSLIGYHFNCGFSQDSLDL